jgi:hypothetical protein
VSALLTWTNTVKIIPRIFRDCLQTRATSRTTLHMAAPQWIFRENYLAWSELVFAGRKSAPGRNRTCDTRFRKPLLYPLSYEGVRTHGTRSGVRPA